MRNGFGAPLPELDGENSYYHLPIARCPKETNHQQVYQDAHGLVDSLRRLASNEVEAYKRKLDSMSGLLSHGPSEQFL